MRLKHFMKRILPFALTTFVAENALARGWHSSPAPEWLYQLEIGVVAIFLLFFLIKKPVRTVLTLLAVVVLPIILLLTVGYLDKSFGFSVTLIAVPILGFVLFKFIDLVFKNDKGP